MANHYQPGERGRQPWSSMIQSGYGAFSQPGRQRQVHHGHVHYRHHGQHATHQLQNIEDHSMVENVNNTKSQEGQSNDQTNQEVELLSYGVDERAQQNHMPHDYNRHAHDHHTDTKDTVTKSTQPLLNPGHGSTHRFWPVGSWVSGLWPFSHHGQQHGGPEEGRTQIGQDAALQVPTEHLVETP